MKEGFGEERKWWQKIGDAIPGYRGYSAREERREMDKLHREFLADRLRTLKTPLTTLVRDLSERGRLFEAGPVDRLLKKLDRLENRIRFASYGYSGFFDLVEVDEKRLRRIYEFDLALTERVESLGELIQQLSETPSKEKLESSLKEIEKEIDDFDTTFDERMRAIENFNSSSSLF